MGLSIEGLWKIVTSLSRYPRPLNEHFVHILSLSNGPQIIHSLVGQIDRASQRYNELTESSIDDQILPNSFSLKAHCPTLPVYESTSTQRLIDPASTQLYLLLISKPDWYTHNDNSLAIFCGALLHLLAQITIIYPHPAQLQSGEIINVIIEMACLHPRAPLLRHLLAHDSADPNGGLNWIRSNPNLSPEIITLGLRDPENKHQTT